MDEFNPDDQYRYDEGFTPVTRRIHRRLSENISWYKKWHQHPMRMSVHVFTIVATLIASVALVASLYRGVNTQAATGIAELFPFQGRLTNPDGTVVADGSYDIVFKLYTVDTGGSAVWTESHTGANDVSTVDGIFNVDLGSLTALSGVDFNQDEYWLGVEVETDGEMSPRIRLGAAPYAFNADTVDGISSEEFLILNGQAGGQTAYGGTAASEDLVLRSTTDSTKGNVVIADDGGNLGVGLTDPFETILDTVNLAPTGASIHVDGGSNASVVIIESNDPGYQLINNTGATDQKWTELFQSTSGFFGIYTRDDTGARVQTTDAPILATNNVTGNVGVGISNPTFKLGIQGNVGPETNNTYNLGSDSNRWQDLYLGPSSLHIGFSITEEGVISYNTANDRLTFQNTDDNTSGFQFNDSSGSSILSINTDWKTLTVDSEPLTNGTAALDINALWNAGSTSLYGIRLDVTDTVSNSSSVLLDLNVDSSDRFAVFKNGNLKVDATTTSQTTPALDINTTWNGTTNHTLLDIDVTNSGGNASSQIIDIDVDGSNRFTLFRDGNITFEGDIIPGTNNALNIGSNIARIQDLYLGPSSLHIGTSTTDEASLSFNTSSDTLLFSIDGTSRLSISDNGNVIIGNGALAAPATDGFLYFPQTAGAPSGTPTSYTGRVPITWDATGDALYIYEGGSWHSISGGGGGGITGSGVSGRVTYWNGTSTVTSNSTFLWSDANKNLSIGSLPSLSTSSVINIPNSKAISARNAASNGDIDLLSLNANDNIQLGSTSGTTTTLQIGVVSGSSRTLEIINTSTGGTVNTDIEGNLTLRDSLNGSNVNPAASGIIRLPNNSKITWRNAGNTADIGAFTVTNNDMLGLGETSTNLVDIQVGNQSSVTKTLRVQNPGIGISNLQLEGNLSLFDQDGFGSAPALSGILRLPNSKSISSRNFADSADISLLSLNSSNNIAFGSTSGSTTTFQIGTVAATLRTLAIYNESTGGRADLDVEGGVIVRNSADGASVSTASTGAIRLPNSQSISSRNNAGSADISLLQLNASDFLQFGNTSASTVTFDSRSGGATNKTLDILNSDGGDLNVTIEGSLRTGGNISVDTDDTYDLGSSSLRWRDLYLGPSSLHLVSKAAETTTARDWKFNIQETAGSDQGSLRIMEGTNQYLSVTTTGQLRTQNGLGSAPAYSFTNDSNAGLWLGGANDLNLGVNGNYQIRIADFGSEGLGAEIVGKSGTATSTAFHRTGDLNAGIYFPALDTISVSSAGADRLTISPTGDVVLGAAALATNATSGFLEIAGSTGAPTGTPATSYTGRYPLTYDATGNSLYVYDGGWQQIGGGGLNGSGSNDQVAVWNGSSSLDGSSSFTWNGTQLYVSAAAVSGTYLTVNDLAAGHALTYSSDGSGSGYLNLSNAALNLDGVYVTGGTNEILLGSSSEAATNLYGGKGKISSSATAWTVNGTGGFGTNNAGGNINIAGGRGTGSASGGSINLQTATAGASGSTLNPLVTRWTVDTNGQFVPGSDDTYDIGSSSIRVRDMYLGPSSLHIGCKASECGSSKEWKFGIEETVGADQGFLKLSEGAVEIATFSSAGAITLGKEDSPADIILHTSSTAGGAIRPSVAAEATLYRNDSVTIDSSGMYSFSAIGLDGFPTISYIDESTGELMVAKCSNIDCSSATTTILDGDLNDRVIGRPSLTIGTDGFPVISYQIQEFGSDYAFYVIKCGNAACSSGNTINEIESLSSTNKGQGSSVAIGSDNFPVVSYTSSNSLKFLKCGNAACSSGNTTVNLSSVGSSSIANSFFTSVAIGADNNPVISYFKRDTGDLRVLKCGNTACTAGNTDTLIDSTGNVGSFNSLAIGNDNFPVISYYDLTTGNVKLVKCGNAACSSGNTISVIGFSGNGYEFQLNPDYDQARYTSIKIGTDGNPLVVFYDSNLTSLTLDNFNLNFIKCGNAACSSGNNEVVVDRPGLTGLSPSLIVGSDGLPAISYSYKSNSAQENSSLKFIKCGFEDCAEATLYSDYGINLGSPTEAFRNAYAMNISTTSLASPTGLLTLGDDSNPTEIVLKNNESASGAIRPSDAPTQVGNPYITNVIASSVNVNDVAVTTGADGFPVMVFFDSQGGNAIKVAKCADLECSAGTTITTIANEASTGYNSKSIAIGNDGFPVIAYYDSTNQDLDFVKCGNAACSSGNSTVTLDSANNTGVSNSMIIGEDGYAIIAYDYATGGDLKIANCANATCTSNNLFTLDTTNDVGNNPTILQTPTGFPVISHHDNTTGDLKMTKCLTATCFSSSIKTTVIKEDVGSLAGMAVGLDGFPIFTYKLSNGTYDDLWITKTECTFEESCNPDSYIDVKVTEDIDITSITPEMVIGIDGNPFILFGPDVDTNSLGAVHCGNATCSQGNTLIPVPTSDVNARYNLGLGSDGWPIMVHTSPISQGQASPYNLEFSKCSDSACSPTYSSIGIDLGTDEYFFRNGYFANLYSKTSSIGNYDVAEDYPTRDQNLKPGDVAVIDPDNPIFIRRSTGSLEEVIVGIVSTTPGLLLGGNTPFGTDIEYQNEKRVPLALAGRVPVSVVGEKIKSGDRLAAANTPGAARKAKDNETTVGIALEDFSGKGTKKILALINLNHDNRASISEFLEDYTLKSIQVTDATINSLQVQSFKAGESTLDSLIVTDNALFKGELAVESGLVLSRLVLDQPSYLISESGEELKPDSITGEQVIVGVKDVGQARTLIIEEAALKSGKILIIKDESGAANINNILIKSANGRLIDGRLDMAIDSSYGVLRLYSDGYDWFTF